MDVSDASKPVVGILGRPSRRANATFLAASICMLLAGLSCPSEEAAEVSRSTRKGADLVIFFTGQELGSLKPCGCSGGQLGGLEKRPAIFDRVPASNRLIVETGPLVESDREQDLIKFRILFEALRLLGYDVVHLTDRDLEIASHLGLSADSQQAFDAIHVGEDGRSRVFTERFTVRGRDFIVNIAAWDPHVAPVESAAELFEEIPGIPAVDILLLRHFDPDSLDTLVSQVPGIDVVVCPSDSDEPRLLSDPGAKPLVFTVGRFGRHICRLGIAIPQQAAEPVLQFEPIPVAEGLPDDPVLVQLYRQYQQLVKDSRLLEEYPRIPLAEDLAFTGSETCKRCHEYEYDKWSTKAHADAFASLKEVGSEYDPECVICHVVGMEYESGFITEDKTPHLKDVGCENCHGPGSEHTRTLGQAATTRPQMACLDCHMPEKSTGYAGHEEEYMRKIVHWREPAAAGNVKH